MQQDICKLMPMQALYIKVQHFKKCAILTFISRKPNSVLQAKAKKSNF